MEFPVLRAACALCCIGSVLGEPVSSPTPGPTPLEPVTATIKESDLEGFSTYPPEVQSLVRLALDLAGHNLNYVYGSADPEKGGMDCSGTMYFLLREAGYDDVPRTASGQYIWVRKAGLFEAVLSDSLDSFEFEDLEPGNLLFWIGTHAVERDPPVTHSMIYLGKLADNGKMVMFGASEGRRFNGRRMNGVSVFDFVLPKSAPGKTQPRFVGYAPLPKKQ